VLIHCALAGIEPVGWGEIGGDPAHVHYWEFDSTNLNDGEPVDISRRHPASRQLSMEKDAEIIANYGNPAYVLGGWTPKMAPLILSQPESISIKRGQTATFHVKVAAIPEVSYQWLNNGKSVRNTTKATLTLENASITDTGSYTVWIKNDSGNVVSSGARLKVKQNNHATDFTD
jgi:pectinesterase